MPQLLIETNLPKSKIPSGFTKRAVPVLAKTLGKPESFCVARIITDLDMSFAGTDEPFAIASVKSIGALGEELNKKHSKALSEFFYKELGLNNDRVYIGFYDEPASIIGYKGTTFLDIPIK